MGRRWLAAITLLAAWVVASPCCSRADELPIIGRINLTYEDYKAKTKELEAKEFRPISLSVYRIKRDNMIAAIWMKAGQIEWMEKYNRSAQEYLADAKTLQNDEYRPISLMVQTVDGQPRFTLLWKKLEGEQYYFRDHVKTADLKKFSADYAQREIYPASISGVEVRGEPNFAVIWEKTRAGSVEYQVGLTEAAFKQQTQAMKAKGFFPNFVSGYMSRGKLLLAAIWTQQEGVTVDAFPSLTEADWQKESAKHDKEKFDLLSLQAVVVSGRPRFSAVWRRVKDLPEEPEETQK